MVLRMLLLVLMLMNNLLYPLLTCEIATQANLIDDRTTVFSDESGRSLADILCDTNTNSKATQVNFPLQHGCQ